VENVGRRVRDGVVAAAEAVEIEVVVVVELLLDGAAVAAVSWLDA
jgi:hypothetical protein